MNQSVTVGGAPKGSRAGSCWQRTETSEEGRQNLMKPKKSIIPVFIPHLGCPCRCVFCNQDSITSVKCSENGKSMPTPDEVAGIIERGVEVSGKGAEVAFYGGSFTAISMSLQRAYLEVAHKYVSDNLLSGIRVSTRPDAIDGDILSELRRFGVSTIELGAQSMEDKVLLLSRRGILQPIP